jgi:hypothetical protein
MAINMLPMVKWGLLPIEGRIWRVIMVHIKDIHMKGRRKEHHIMGHRKMEHHKAKQLKEHHMKELFKEH